MELVNGTKCDMWVSADLLCSLVFPALTKYKKNKYMQKTSNGAGPHWAALICNILPGKNKTTLNELNAKFRFLDTFCYASHALCVCCSPAPFFSGRAHVLMHANLLILPAVGTITPFPICPRHCVSKQQMVAKGHSSMLMMTLPARIVA